MTRIPPMTEDQLDFMSKQSERAAHKATRRTLRSAFVGYVILIAGVLAMYQNGQHVSNGERDAIIRSGTVVSVEGCNRDFADKEQFISLLERLQSASKRSARLQHLKTTDPQVKLALDFYSDEIARAKRELPDCRREQHMLTDDPERTQPWPPLARYPDDRSGQRRDSSRP